MYKTLKLFSKGTCTLSSALYISTFELSTHAPASFPNPLFAYRHSTDRESCQEKNTKEAAMSLTALLDWTLGYL